VVSGRGVGDGGGGAGSSVGVGSEGRGSEPSTRGLGVRDGGFADGVPGSARRVCCDSSGAGALPGASGAPREKATTPPQATAATRTATATTLLSGARRRVEGAAVSGPASAGVAAAGAAASDMPSVVASGGSGTDFCRGASSAPASVPGRYSTAGGRGARVGGAVGFHLRTAVRAADRPVQRSAAYGAGGGTDHGAVTLSQRAGMWG
jgi:hypothetical protein